MGIEQLIPLIASQGPLGVMLVVITLAYREKDRQLKEERAARIQDAKDFNQMALDLQSKVLSAVDKLSDILDEMKQRFMGAPPRQGSGRG